ncbi:MULTISPECIES: cupin domain-containing protein [unclassified Spirosoma]|uniref:cupin domain-containing protein n=1 Tax=unclassified Spirosoma TaxID=2621999 RepID=UPI00095E5181|nr:MULTISPECIES: cupin domain-containing protein [unclassified Spirosoma]MBN8822085.1 cupin domain-containing protein [Spirosoma sp.]OJW80486.1 MAG: cupin [Spirosoma sp. 48-14]
MTDLLRNLFSPDDGVRQLKTVSTEFVELFRHGSLVVEYYKPDRIDKQQPHERDEVYVITTGSGTFLYAGTSMSVKPGDLLFVPAGVEHRFENFTDDFATWVLFYGPIGGEK